MENSSISTISKKFMGFMWLCLFKSLQKNTMKALNEFWAFRWFKIGILFKKIYCRVSKQREDTNRNHPMLWKWWLKWRPECGTLRFMGLKWCASKMCHYFFSLLIIIVNRTSQVDRYKREKHIIW